MRNGLLRQMQSSAKCLPHYEPRKDPVKRQPGGSKPKQSWNKHFRLRGNLRISESSHELRNYLPSLCYLGQRVKKLMLLREPLTSFVKENTSILCVVVTIHRLVPVEVDCCVFFWCREFQTG